MDSSQSQHQQQQPQPFVKKKETRGRKPKPKDEKKDEQQAKRMKAQQQPSVDERYTQLKSLVPVLYDWFANHSLVCLAFSLLPLNEEARSPSVKKYKLSWYHTP